MTIAADRWLRRISTAASIGFALMLGATVAYIAWPAVTAALGAKPAPAPAPPPVYSVGDTADVPAEWYAHDDRTLVIFARQSCGACEKAQPFLKDLVSSVDGRAGVVMGFPPGAEDDDRAFARAIGVTPGRTWPTPSGLRVRATPTLLLLDRSGRVLGAWEGVSNPGRQDEIQTTVASALR